MVRLQILTLNWGLLLAWTLNWGLSVWMVRGAELCGLKVSGAWLNGLGCSWLQWWSGLRENWERRRRWIELKALSVAIYGWGNSAKFSELEGPICKLELEFNWVRVCVWAGSSFNLSLGRFTLVHEASTPVQSRFRAN